ncbi:unnamed protein product, partial [Polarella glacialis]
VAAIVPSISSLTARDSPREPLIARWPPWNQDHEASPAPEAGYTLDEALQAYRPRLVICACMPPGMDWSVNFRKSQSVVEYILVGPTDSDRSGIPSLTWGGAEPFKAKGRSQEIPRFAVDGFNRREIPHLSDLCIGTDDAPGRVGVNSVVSFRRLLKPKLSFEATRPSLPGLESPVQFGQGRQLPLPTAAVRNEDADNDLEDFLKMDG